MADIHHTHQHDHGDRGDQTELNRADAFFVFQRLSLK